MSAFKHWGFHSIDIVGDLLKATVSTNPQCLGLIPKENIVFNKKSIFDPNRKVLVLSGGGSGHEPLHAGFVGDNLLDIAVAGSIFASPSTKQVLSAIVTISKLIEAKNLPKKSFLAVVKNYTGDILNFGLALERAKHLGIDAEILIVGDDVAVAKTSSLVGRRGLAGTALVHKIASAAASKGYDLRQIVKLANSVVENLVTIGASLNHCSIPTTEKSASEKEDKDHEEDEEKKSSLKLDECEIGMGIHNESGVKRIKIANLDELVKLLLKYALDQNDPERSFVKSFDKEVVLLINNLGGTSNLELLTFCHQVIEQLKNDYNLKPTRVYCGTFVSSLNGNGLSVTLLANPEKFLDYLDLPTSCIGWNSSVVPINGAETQDKYSVIEDPYDPNKIDKENAHSTLKASDLEVTKQILKAVVQKIIEIEPKVTHYDTIVGDGDAGLTLVAGAKAISEQLENPDSDLNKNIDKPVFTISEIATLCSDSMGGTSGGLYSIYMSALAAYLRDNGLKNGETKTVTVGYFTEGLEFALRSLFKYTRARTGDRTLVDSLQPFVDTFKSTGGDLSKASKAAWKGAESTKQLDAKVGRASYIAKSELSGIPDPGAVGLAAIFEAISDTMNK